jgi:type III secretory pathway component EscR
MSEWGDLSLKTGFLISKPFPVIIDASISGICLPEGMKIFAPELVSD